MIDTDILRELMGRARKLEQDSRLLAQDIEAIIVAAEQLSIDEPEEK